MEHIVEIPDCIKSKEKADPFSLDYGWPVREEIVRCRDCVHHFTDDEEPGMVCRRRCLDEWRLKHEIEFLTEPDGFCAWGKRHG